MKRTILYILMSCLVLAFNSCEDNIEDATSKHVYGEDESPYLRSDVEAIVTNNLEFEVGRFEAKTINLEDYASKFMAKMGMTVDQVISGLNNGTVVFYNINVTRGIWNKAATTKGSAGWYYNAAGGITDGTGEYVSTLDFIKDSKQLVINVNESAKAGDESAFNVGFALKGPDYDDYVRFSFNVAVTDPSLMNTSVSIPEGDYAAGSINLYDYADFIQYNMGMSVDDLLANIDTNEGGTVRLYVVNRETGVWDTESGYTANAPGYWMNASAEVCNWGADGFSLYAELNTDEGLLNIGRAPGLAAGTTFKLCLGFRDTNDELHFFRFIITATLE